MINVQGRISMEINKNDKVYRFNMPWGAPYQECYNAAIEIANNIVEISKQAEETAKKAEAEKAAVEQPKEVIDPEVVQS